MSSPSQSFVATSPLSPSTARHRRQRSRFTYKQLSLLASYSPTCPLRCIAHIDLDAFYAQCEMVRLGVPADQPLAVQQWQGLIAINYPARAFGLSRHVTIEEARQKCPHIITQHVATWKEGEDCWAYRDDAFKNMATHKVSLDPYRLESRRILATIKDALPAAPLQRVEKASVDEVFLDLSAQIHMLLLERYPELRGPAPYDDPTEPLPAPPTSALDWSATDALVDLDPGEAEEDAPDWDDVAMQLGAEIVRGVRAAVRAKLKYTCSAGVARNKMLAKLGSGHHKPDGQTVVRNRAAGRFLGGFKVTKIRNLGGKLGDAVVGQFNTDAIAQLLDVPQEAMMKALGDETGAWLYNTVRGRDASEVTPRTAIKSMLSAKSFRPPLNDTAHAARWLRIFAADLASRLRDNDADEGGGSAPPRRPRTLNLHHRQGAAPRSRSAPIPPGRALLAADALFGLARDLFAQVVVDGRAWPCANLSLSLAGFEDPVLGNRGIGSFLVKGEQARALAAPAPPPPAAHDSNAGAASAAGGSGGAGDGARPTKKRKTETPPARLDSFFARQDAAMPPAPPADFDDVPSAQPEMPFAGDDKDDYEHDDNDADADPRRAADDARALPEDQYRCAQCGRGVPLGDRAEHDDWHVAREMQRAEDERGRRAEATARDRERDRVAQAQTKRPAVRGRGRPSASVSNPARGGGGGAGAGAGATGGGGRATERGQMKLTFG